jgi:hypothetical protein
VGPHYPKSSFVFIKWRIPSIAIGDDPRELDRNILALDYKRTVADLCTHVDSKNPHPLRLFEGVPLVYSTNNLLRASFTFSHHMCECAE